MLTNKNYACKQYGTKPIFYNKKSSINWREKKYATVKSKHCVILLKSYS